MKKKLFAGLIAAVFVGSCVSVEIAMAASAVKPGSSISKGSTQKEEFKPVYSQGTKSDGAKRSTVSGGKPTNVHNLTGHSKRSNSNNHYGQASGGSRRTQ